MRGRMSAVLLAAALSASACQTAKLYDGNSLAGMPSKASYVDADAYVRDAIIYLYPRSCVFYRTSDGVRMSENIKPDSFSFIGIAENAAKDGWYLALLSVTNTYAGRSQKFYFNKDTGDYSCGGHPTRQTGQPIGIVTGRHLDLDSLAAVNVASAAGGPALPSGPSSRRAIAGPSAAEIAAGSTDYRLCAIAAKPDGSAWDPGEGYREYVKEAERRNLTPAVCAKIVARQ